MFRPSTQNDINRYDRAVDSAIATCGGDVRGALKALIIANEFLEEELRRMLETCASSVLNDIPDRQVA